MDTSGHSSPIWAYRANAHKMRVSHDEDRSNPKDMCSLGVVDLDLLLSPDAFGLQAFDSTKPLTRMLLGSSPCELRLMLPDTKLGTDGSITCPRLRLGGRVIFRRRWPKAVFTTMKRRAKEVERLRRSAHHRSDLVFRHSAPGFCPICEVKIESALDVHMISSHLELGQLWRCPVEWCAVWKGSVRDCLGHLNGKHGGSTSFTDERCEVLSPMDGDQGCMADGPSSGCFGHCGGRTSVP